MNPERLLLRLGTMERSILQIYS